MSDSYESYSRQQLIDRIEQTEEQLSGLFDRKRKYKAEAEYYRRELAKAHEILGRVTHQLSERWDSVNLTEYFPTDNLRGRRGPHNPTGARDE